MKEWCFYKHTHNYSINADYYCILRMRMITSLLHHPSIIPSPLPSFHHTVLPLSSLHHSVSPLSSLCHCLSSIIPPSFCLSSIIPPSFCLYHLSIILSLLCHPSIILSLHYSPAPFKPGRFRPWDFLVLCLSEG